MAKGKLSELLGKLRPQKSGGSRSGTPKKRKPPAKRLAKTRFLIKVAAAIASIIFIFGFLLVTIYGHDLPNIDKLYDDNLQPSILVLDYKGETVATYGDYFTEFVQYKDLPKDIVNAVVATEDRRFFQHWGLDPRGMARAMVSNLLHGKLQQGGSTITQQLAKNVFLKPERKLKRKIQEAMLAVWLEKKYSKQQIMSMYLNRVYLGGGVFGVDAASRKYFNKSAKKLNLYESAMLAGMLKAPSTYSPVNNPRLAAERTEQVLLNMVDDGKITEAQMKKALKTGAQVKVQLNNPSNHYYTDFIVDQVQELIGKPEENLVVRTTFRPDLQAMSEQAISKTMLEFADKNNAHQAAMVLMKPDGAILSIIGGVDYAASQFNRATQAQRQPGSSFKLFVYTAAMLYGKTPDDIVNDEQTTIGRWTPSNYDGRYHGPVTLREAFSHSYNTAAANLAQEVGINNVVFIAHKMGIRSSLAEVPSLALGSSEVNLLEMTESYALVANNGMSVNPYAIEQIKTQNGDLLYQHEQPPVYRILDEETVHKMNDLLLSVVTSGTARGASIGRDAAGKTGTTQDFHDAWFIGFTPQLVGGVWVGNDDNAQMNKVTGGSMPARIWAAVMKPALAGTPARGIDRNYGSFGSTVSTGVSNFWGSLLGSDDNEDKQQLRPVQHHYIEPPHVEPQPIQQNRDEEDDFDPHKYGFGTVPEPQTDNHQLHSY